MVKLLENKGIKETEETRKIFNELRNNFFKKEVKNIREKFH